MPTRKLEDILPHVLPYAPGCPEVLAVQKLRLAAIDLCERTECWRHVLDMTLTAQGQAIPFPDYATIHRIEHATFNGEDLTPIEYTEVDPTYLADDAPEENPCYITQTETDTLSIIPYRNGTVSLSMFLKPRSGTEYGRVPEDPMHDYLNQIPEFMFTQHAETIAFGALWRILTIPKQPFSDPSTAAFYNGEFMRRASSKSTSGMAGQQKARLRTTPSWV